VLADDDHQGRDEHGADQERVYEHEQRGLVELG
jgi:hypothetical protein